MKHLKVVATVVLMFFFTKATPQNEDMKQASIKIGTAAKEWAKQRLQTMSPEEKIGQLFMISVWPEWNDARLQSIYKAAKDHHVGGVCFFAGAAAQQVAISNKLNAEAKIPLMIGIDGEWGVGMRVKDAHSFPFAMNVGAVKDTSLIYEMGQQIGRHCKRLGVHINFAPVHDLNNNPQNPVINYRSYGSGTENVSQKVSHYIAGMQSQGVLAVAKHFPGHGDTHTDSHHALPLINKSKSEFENNEFLPFKQSINNGLQALMTGHLKVPSLDSTGCPASLSPLLIQGIIKGELGFNGLIVSDALNMNAVNKGYPNHYLQAFLAGNDILLFPADVAEGVKQLKQGLQEGAFSEDELNARCLRVLQYKYALGVTRFTPLSDDGIIRDLNPTAAKVLNRQLLSQSITLVRNVNNSLPIMALDKKRLALLSINNNAEGFAAQAQLYADVSIFNEKVKTADDVIRLRAQLMPFDEIIIGLHGKQKNKTANYGINKHAIGLMNALSEEKVVHAVAMCNPFALRLLKEEAFKRLTSLSFTYSNEPEIQRLAIDAVFGGIAFQGVFPLSLNAYLQEGVSCTTTACRLGYSTVPEELGLDSDTLSQIDTLIQEAIEKKAMPGCQILIAKNGKVAYHKAFGYHTYDQRTRVKNSDVYDVASVTKVAAATSLVMQLADEGLLDLNVGIGHYLPELRGKPKGALSAKEIMLHQSGLKSYIGFDYNLIDQTQLHEDLFNKKRTEIYNIKLGPGLYMTRNYAIKKDYISTTKTEHCSVKVAKNIYTFPAYRDEMYALMDESPLSSKTYRYSDLGYYYIMRLLEAQGQKRIDELAQERLFRPLGMNRTLYTPLERISKEEIVPTADETFFRRQLLHGYVHDQGAALLGGVGAHAGLFSNANDLAKLMQTFLNHGFYGRASYFKPQTVAYHTQHTENGYRRGVGFDKPETDTKRPQPTCEAASPSTFGHTGFTGTAVWADPEHDLIYIMLSNRIHPHAHNTKFLTENIRPRIQQIIYDAIR